MSTQSEQVAHTIISQLGNMALSMLGAKNLLSLTEGGLQFKIGRNSKKVTHVEIILDPSDTYNVRFIKVGRAPKYEIKTLSKVEGVYVDRLHEVIEAHTGMYTHL